MTSHSSVVWSDRWQEQIPADEAQMWTAFAEQIAAVARAVSVRTGHPADRVFHIKQHIGVRATVRILPGLPHPLSSGVFAAPTSYECYVRFSNGAVRRQVDGILDVRGLALKLLGVAGPRLDGSADTTQDFLFVTTPAVPTDSPAEFLALAQASIGGPLFLPFKLVRAVGLVRTTQILTRLALMPQPRSLASATWFTAVPLQLDPAAMKLQLLPELPMMAEEVRRGATLRDDLVTRLKSGPLRYRLRAQLFIDERRTPIERASMPWRERDASFHDVAVLEIPAQDVEAPDGDALSERVGRLGFDPWHGLTAHRPLGAIQRGRRAAYARSRSQRHAAPEPHA